MVPVTGIEEVVRLLDSTNQATTDVVLVPEQCAMVEIGGRRFHITVEEVE